MQLNGVVMKSRVLLSSFLAAVTTLNVNAQEYDDMYFRSTDRAKFERPSAKTNERQVEKEMAKYTAGKSTFANPTDSYSARVVNPEYTARSVTQAVAGESDYFIDNYSVPVQQSTNSLSYAPGYYGPCTYDSSPYYNSTSSPFHSPYFDRWGYSPYGNSGTYMGSPYSYGYSPYGSMYGAPYSPFAYGGYGSGWNTALGFGMSPYSSSWWNTGLSFMFGSGSYGYPYGYGGYSNYNYCPGNTYAAVNDNNGRRVTYGKRTSRTNDQAANYAIDNARQDDYSSRTGRTRELIGGRTDNTSASREYYNPGWRRADYSNSQTRSYVSPGSRSNLWNGSSDNSNRSFFNSDSRSSSFGGNTRSSVGSSTGSSVGRSRGRD